MAEFTVRKGDVLEVPADLLVLKYAQGFYGADRAVAAHLVSADRCRKEDIQPTPGNYVAIETAGAIAPERVLFIGTPALDGITYETITGLAYRAVHAITEQGLPVAEITTTVHGPGFGLDGGEALQRMIRGFEDGLHSCGTSPLRKVTFVTLSGRQERMLKAALAGYRPEPEPASPPPAHGASPTMPVESALANRTPQTRVRGPEAPVSPTATQKGRIFVALPFSDEFQNVYEYGIYPAVRNCGLICERVDETHFAGDVLNRIREGIKGADMVIADLTEARPNVYLEVGYAWGKGVPVIFVARKGETLHFDVAAHRCIYYGRFKQLASDLEELIRGIRRSQPG